MTEFTHFYLDIEKDIIGNLYQDEKRLFYELETPNHKTGNLIRNLAGVCGLPLSLREDGLQVICGEIPCYIDAYNREIYIFRMGNTKVANIYPDGRVEMKASIPAIAKTLMSQTKDYLPDESRTIFKTYILQDCKFRSDLHTHMNGNLDPDILIALGIYHQIRYPLYYIKKLNLSLSGAQKAMLEAQREKVARQFVNTDLTGKYLDRKIDDNTFINFAELILEHLDHAQENIIKIRTSLVVLKDGQAVFTNLEKVYLYRYVFTKGSAHEHPVRLRNTSLIPDEDVRRYLAQMLKDGEDPRYKHNSLFQNKLLWIARSFCRYGVNYAEISDTTLVKKYESIQMLKEVHEIMPYVTAETGVTLRFLAAMRRIPLTIVKDRITPQDYLRQNIQVLQAVMYDPYVAGCDFVGEEINDIIELKPLIAEIVRLTVKEPDFVVRIHAGENDSLRDNIAHSIACVRDSLMEGQAMPRMRIGHGLYTYSLNSERGRRLLREIRDLNITLEFQLSSNVRLNNLSALDFHPLRQYLKKGIRCVQGTDGAALYGTNSIDEQLSLEKLLHVTKEEQLAMRKAEQAVIDDGLEMFARKSRKFEDLCGDRSIEDTLLSLMEDGSIYRDLKLNSRRSFDSTYELSDKIRELPWDRTPVIIAGGSFNTDKRTTRVTRAGVRQLEALMEELSPDEVFFVIGSKLSGYEKYLLEHNEKGFRIYAFVPSRITLQEKKKLMEAGIRIRVSPEISSMGLYKSFDYEIYERRPSVTIVFDGNSAGSNLIQEAKNGKGKSAIYIWEGCTSLRDKMRSLEGYVTAFGEKQPLVSLIRRSITGGSSS